MIFDVLALKFLKGVLRGLVYSIKALEGVFSFVKVLSDGL